MTAGIRTRHQAACRSDTGARCNCKPSYEASVGAGRDGVKVRRPFKTLAAARQWQAEQRAAAGRGVAIATTTRTVREAAAELVRGMQAGTYPHAGGHAVQAECHPRRPVGAAPARAARSRSGEARAAAAS